jgi:hypothetical protein
MSATRAESQPLGSARLALFLALALALRAFGYSLDYRDAFRGYFLAQPAKYLPGGVWVLPGRALALSEVGVKVVHSGAAQVIEGCFMPVGAVVVFTPYLIFGDTGPMPVAGVAACFVAAAALLCLHPALFNRTATWILRRLGQAAVEVRLSARIVISMLLTYVGFWVVAGVGFYLLVSSVHEVLVNLAAMSMAWVIGLIAFLAPAGGGVREGALALLLVPILPSPLPAALALLARIWWTVAELILVLAAVISRRRTESQPDQARLPRTCLRCSRAISLICPPSSVSSFSYWPATSGLMGRLWAAL